MPNSWASAGRWLALALIGQAAALALIDAGTRIHYQHYRLPAEALADPWLRWPLLAAAVQTLLVTAGLVARREAIIAWTHSGRHAAQFAAVVAVCGCFAAAVSRDPRFFFAEAALALLVQLVNAANILLFAWALPAASLKVLGQKLEAVLDSRRLVPLAAIWVTVVSALLAGFVYQRHPHVADEVAYLYPARYFAAGRLTLPPPPVQPAFDVDLMEYHPDKWYSVVPVGWPAVLAIGAALGVPWLVNPVLGGLNILLAYLFLLELYPRRTARISVVLLALSPWNVYLAMSYMTHTLTMTCALLALLGIALARRTGLARWALLAGAAVGAGTLIRQLDGAIVGALAAAWAIGIGGKRLKFGSLAALGAATVLTAALTLPYNKALVGKATSIPIMQYMDEHHGLHSNDYGFGPDRGMGWATDAYPGHTPFEALINAELNGSCLDTDLFGWSTGSLVLIAILVFSGGLRRPDYAMLAAIALVVLAYAPYWGTGGPDFGARYWYVMLVPCVALTARGLERLEQGAPEQDNLEHGNGVRATAAVAALCGLALVVYFPWRAADKYYHYLRMRPDVRALAHAYDFGRSLVLIRGDGFPDYASAAIYNPIDLHANAPVYAWDRDPAVHSQLLRAYSDRPVWIVEGPSVTHDGFRVAAGPLPPAAAAP